MRTAQQRREEDEGPEGDGRAMASGEASSQHCGTREKPLKPRAPHSQHL